MTNNIKINKGNKFNMESFFYLIIIILIICFISILFINFSKMRSDKPSSEYDIQTPLKGDAKNMNLCPTGCDRGICKKKQVNVNMTFNVNFVQIKQQIHFM